MQFSQSVIATVKVERNKKLYLLQYTTFWWTTALSLLQFLWLFGSDSVFPVNKTDTKFLYLLHSGGILSAGYLRVFLLLVEHMMTSILALFHSSNEGEVNGFPLDLI